MIEMLPILTVILIAGGLLAMGIYLIRQEVGQTGHLAQHAQERGWSLEKHPSVSRALIFKGQRDPVGWRIELYRSGRYQSAMTSWQAQDAALPAGPVMIGAGLEELYLSEEGDSGDQAGSAQLGMEFLDRPAGWGAPALPGWLGLAHLGIDLGRIDPQPVGSAAFQERYNVLVASLESAQSILSPQVEALLLDWARSQVSSELPLVVANPEGLSVRLANDDAYKEPQILDRLVALGLALIEAINADRSDER